MDSLETGSARTKLCLKEQQDIHRHGERNKNSPARLNKGFNSRLAELGSTDTQSTKWLKCDNKNDEDISLNVDNSSFKKIRQKFNK